MLNAFYSKIKWSNTFKEGSVGIERRILSEQIDVSFSLVFLEHVCVQTRFVLKDFLTQHAFNTSSDNMSFNVPLTLVFLGPLLAAFLALPYRLGPTSYLLDSFGNQTGKLCKQATFQNRGILMTEKNLWRIALRLRRKLCTSCTPN